MQLPTKSWQQYEAGVEYKRKIGLYETVRCNERFYRGDQWQNSSSQDLPHPVFNIVRRITDFLVSAVASGNIGITYSCEDLLYSDSSAVREALKNGISILNKNARYRWETSHMDQKLYRLLLDAAISGDGAVYCSWNPDINGGSVYSGDISVECVDNVNLFVSDVNRADIQSQDYIIISGRDTVARLRREALKYGATPEQAQKIVPDSVSDSGGLNRSAGDLAGYELDCDGGKATFIIKFYRDNGKVVFEKSCRNCIIHSCVTDCRLYPVAYFNWYPTKNSFHGSSPISNIIPNQKYINRAYAMMMKHMTDTAFSKVIYDSSRIPEWTNEVGEAIAAVGGGNMSDAVSVVGVGKMENGYLELINNAVSVTKELMGATESALGNVSPDNTSAILALQESARIPLYQVRANLYRFIEDLSDIWADMMCAFFPASRPVPFFSADSGEVSLGNADFGLLREFALKSRIDVGESDRYTASSIQSLLDHLLDGNHISVIQYIERLPSGLISDRSKLIEELRSIGADNNTTETMKGNNESE